MKPPASKSALSCLCITTAVAVLFGCMAAEPEPDPLRFRYDSSTGTCRNGVGSTGFNKYTVAQVRASHDAECLDLSGINLMSLQQDTALASGDSMVGWNFKGSLFARTMLWHSHLVDAQLQGADLSGADFGYATVTGSSDWYTRLKWPYTDCNLIGSSRMECRH
jgi:hypothetical protein